jgi:hypothetical protein
VNVKSTRGQKRINNQLVVITSSTFRTTKILQSIQISFMLYEE